jgi:hypothetical protein
MKLLSTKVFQSDNNKVKLHLAAPVSGYCIICERTQFSEVCQGILALNRDATKGVWRGGEVALGLKWHLISSGSLFQ